MSERELTTSEQVMYKLVKRQLRKIRKEIPLGAHWFTSDSALALVQHLEQDEHNVTAATEVFTAYLLATGRAEEVLCALKGLLRRKGRETLVPMDGAYILN